MLGQLTRQEETDRVCVACLIYSAQWTDVYVGVRCTLHMHIKYKLMKSQ